MRKIIIAATLVTAAFSTAGATWADQPAQPGCFGRARSAGVHEIGGKAWGDIASDRGSLNSDMNRAYKESPACD